MRVLLVDDEPELVFTLAERLELRGHEVAAVCSGREALDRLAEQPYDVAVVDVKMPGMSGEILLSRIGQEYPDVPVILMTGHAATDQASEDARLAASATLFKPVDIEELVRTMKACVQSDEG